MMRTVNEMYLQRSNVTSSAYEMHNYKINRTSGTFEYLHRARKITDDVSDLLLSFDSLAVPSTTIARIYGLGSGPSRDVSERAARHFDMVLASTERPNKRRRRYRDLFSSRSAEAGFFADRNERSRQTRLKLGEKVHG